MKNAIYRTDLGTSTARPVKGILEVSDLPEDDFAVRLADQVALLEANEAIIEIDESESFSDLDDDEDTYDYTVDTTATPPVALTPITIDRYSLVQKQARVRQTRDLLISEAIAASNYDRFISDADLGTYATFISALRSISDAEPSPDTVSFPTLGSIAGAGDRVLTRQYRRGNVLGSVNLSGGVPTGALLETTTTIDGLLLRTADGSQLCATHILAGYFSAGVLTTTWDFPADFISAAAVRPFAFLSTVNAAGSADGLTALEIRQCQVFKSAHDASSVTFQVRPTDGFTFGGSDDCWLVAFAFGRYAS